MNNKFLKKIIFFFTILVIIILISIVFIKNHLNKNDNVAEQIAESDEIEGYGKNGNGGIDYQSYFDVKACIQKYLNNINMNSLQYFSVSYDMDANYSQILDENEIKQKIINLLSHKYITEKNITIENLYEHINVLQDMSIFVPIEISLIQDNDFKSFLVHGLIESSEDYSVIDEIFAIVNISLSEKAFSIELIDGDYTSISEIKINQFEDTIIANEDNEFVIEHLKPEDFPKEYINIYKGLAFGAPEKLYDLLDKDYRNARFENFENFKNYIEKNKSKISKIRLEKYKIDFNNNVRRYICRDQNENYYVINENEMLQDYTMMLDIYTIDIPEITEEYDSSEDNEKVVLNIGKLIQATKNEDYRYVYNKLNESFKNANFKTQQDFEKFIKEKFDAKEDDITYEKYENINGVHVYNIKVTDKNKTINAKVAMNLKDGRDFEFSFSTEN